MNSRRARIWRMHVILFFAVCVHLGLVSYAVVTVPINNTGYSYTAMFQLVSAPVDSTSNETVQYVRQILDTGSNELFTYNSSTNALDDDFDRPACLALSVDGTEIDFFPVPSSATCDEVATQVSLGQATAQSNYSIADILFIENPHLHEWERGNGVIGLSYCSSCSSLTTFQQLVQNASDDMNDDNPYTQQGGDDLIFGLDFRDDNYVVITDASGDKYKGSSGSDSSMQLGGVSSTFSGSVDWLQQPSSNPGYHTFFMKDFKFCGAEPLGNYSQVWQVLVDSGSACLTLPAEIYESFEAWFDNDSIITDVDTMPVFSFKVNIDSSSSLYIPLSSLLLNTSAIDSENGAPYVTLSSGAAGLNASATTGDGVLMRLCILKGNDVEYSDGELVYPAPSIIFGSMAMRGIYFAADYTTTSVGLANKLSNNYVAGLTFNSGGPGCRAPQRCAGDEAYFPWKNRCKDPGCDNYFFMKFNDDTKECEYIQGNVIAGLFLILLFAIMEIASYLMMQYSAFSFVSGTVGQGVISFSSEERAISPETAILLQQYRSFVGAGTFDPITIALGYYISIPVDWVLKVSLDGESNIHQSPASTNDAQDEIPLRENLRGNQRSRRVGGGRVQAPRHRDGDQGDDSALINPGHGPEEDFPRTPIS